MGEGRAAAAAEAVAAKHGGGERRDFQTDAGIGARAAEPFYRATPQQPMDVVRRRVLRCRNDRVIGIEDDRAAATALAELTADLPTSLSALDRAQLRLGGSMGRIAPRVVIPVARARMRSMVGHMIVDARDRQFTRTVAKLRPWPTGPAPAAIRHYHDDDDDDFHIPF